MPATRQQNGDMTANEPIAAQKKMAFSHGWVLFTSMSKQARTIPRTAE
jgi:hypothetical protein